MLETLLQDREVTQAQETVEESQSASLDPSRTGSLAPPWGPAVSRRKLASAQASDSHTGQKHPAENTECGLLPGLQSGTLLGLPERW